MVNHFIFSASLTSLASFIAAISVWLLNPTKRLNRFLGVYWLSIGFWSFLVGSQFRTINLLSPFWWGWFLHLGCTFIPVLLFHFVIAFTNEKRPAVCRALIVSYAITIAFNLLNLWTAIFTNGTTYRDAYAYPQPALLYPLYFLLFVMLVAWGTLLLIRYLPSLPVSERAALTFLLVTHVLAYMGGMDNFLIMIDLRISPLYPYGLYLIPPYALTTMYAVYLHRLLEVGA